MKPLSARARTALIGLLEQHEAGRGMFHVRDIHGKHASARALLARHFISNEVRTSPAATQQQLNITTRAYPDWYSLTPKGVTHARRLRALQRLG